MADKRQISSKNAPAAIGPYSQAMRSGNLIFCSGMIGIDPATGTVPEGIEAQTRQVMKNIGALLADNGANYHNIIKTTVFIKDMNDFAKVNEIYGSYFEELPPARSTVEVSRLPKDVLVEIESIVAVD